MMEGLDPEEARAIFDPALQLMMDAVHRYEGYVAQSRGDGIFALFGAPIAQEDHARRALYAALRMQDEIKRYSDRLRIQRGLPLAIRVGVNSGEMVLRSIRKDDLHTDYVPIGHSVNLAARMEGLATPGSIAVAESTYRATQGYFRFRELGPIEVKGVSEPIRVYDLEGIGTLRTSLEVSRGTRLLTLRRPSGRDGRFGIGARQSNRRERAGGRHHRRARRRQEPPLLRVSRALQGAGSCDPRGTRCSAREGASAATNA
jgi:class 3 adenylate cyclase